jgi:predicted permease
MGFVAKELLFSIRGLRKSPGFSLVAVATLALAIGANTVVFGVLNALVLRPLNVPHSETLFAIQRASDTTMPMSYPDYIDLRDHSSSFDGLAAFSIAPVALDTGSSSYQAWIEEVSGNYFDVLGIRPYLGHVFHRSDEHGANSAPYIVLSYAYWNARFSGDPGVVGQTVRLNGHPFTVVGVAPRDFEGTLLAFSPDFFAPIVNKEQIEGADSLDSRSNHASVFMAMGHLKRGVSKTQAVSDLNSTGLYLEKNYPLDDTKMSFTLALPALFGDQMGRPVRAFITGLMLLAGLVLLAACTNLGGVFAARTADRSSEFALRLALGSSHRRILSQLFGEAVLISSVGGILGLFGSIALLHWLSAWRPFPRVPLHIAVNPDAKVYGVALLLAIVSGFLFGMVPMRQVLKVNPYQIIKSGSIAKSGRRITLRDFLLVAQIAICAVLLTSSIVAIRGLVRSLHSDFGFDPNNTILAMTNLKLGGYEQSKVPAMQKRMIDTLMTIPTVTSVGLIDRVPLNSTGVSDRNVFTVDTTDLRVSNAAADAVQFSISPEYFHTAGTNLLYGRSFTWHDDATAPRVAIVNKEFAREVFGSPADAIGKYYKTSDGVRIQVVGLVQDGKYGSLTETQQSAMFFPIMQSPMKETSLVIRSDSDATQMTSTAKNILHGLDPGLAFLIEPWNKELDSVLFPSRIATLSLAVLGVMAALLAIIGVSGMAAYSVSRRVRELGIRVALGAQNRQVLSSALGPVIRLFAIGSVVGLFVGILASRLLAFIVYQATPRDPVVLSGVILALSLLGILATWVPARRAMSVDPAILMRER